jgi:hypothetical protein
LQDSLIVKFDDVIAGAQSQGLFEFSDATQK